MNQKISTSQGGNGRANSLPDPNNSYSLFFKSDLMLDLNKFEATYLLQDPSGNLSYNDTEIVQTASQIVAEYRAILRGLELAKDLGILQVRVLGDSILTVDHLNGC